MYINKKLMICLLFALCNGNLLVWVVNDFNDFTIFFEYSQQWTKLDGCFDLDKTLVSMDIKLTVW